MANVNVFLSLNTHFTSIEKQVLKTYTNLCFLGNTPVLTPNVWANQNPKVVTRSRESNSGPKDCEADALPHDHHILYRFSNKVDFQNRP